MTERSVPPQQGASESLARRHRPRGGSTRSFSLSWALLVLVLSSSGAVAVIGASSVAHPEGTSVAGAASTLLSGHAYPTPIRHVFVVVLENAKQSTVLKNGPYESALSTTYATAKNYYAVCHPSAPNYLALTSGKAFQCGSDAYTTHSTKNLGSVLQTANLTWKSYQQSMPTACDTNNSYPYAFRHNPFVYYPNIVGSSSVCSQHDVSFQAWNSDVAKKTIPAFGFFTPNLRNDGHDTGVAYADTWLKGWLAPLLNTTFYRNSVFFVTYDESVNDNSGYSGLSGGHVFFVAVSPYANSGFALTGNVSHYNLLTTIQWLLGLPSCGNNDNASKFPPMKSLFSFPAASGGLSVAPSATPSIGPAPLVVRLAAGASGGTAPYTYSWNFGDGTTGTSSSPNHTFATAGSFAVSVIVHDSAGHQATGSRAVTVSSPLLGIVSSLRTGPLVAQSPSTFWSLVAQTATVSGLAKNPAIHTYLGQTPFNGFRYGVNEDNCNISIAVSYSDSGAASKGCGYSISTLKSFCAARATGCQTILTLPGENNNSKEDAAIAKWIVSTVGFQPTFWTIGNEPMGWTHYGIPWSKWHTTDHVAPTPLAYAFDVKAAIAAVTAVDPGAKFIGLEAACQCNTAWFQSVAHIDGAQISAIAYHTYPSLGLTSETLSQFYSVLASAHNLTTSLATVRADISGQCGGCTALPIFVNEYNAGPGWSPSNYGGTYANAAFLAASVTQALRVNISQLTIFDLQTYSKTTYGYSLMNGASTVGPTGLLYSGILSHLILGKVYAASVKTSVGDVWSVLTRRGTTDTLLVVNTNLSHAIALSLGKVFPTGVFGNAYSWGPAGKTPTASSGLIATSYSIPAQGILLLRVANALFAPAAAGGPGPRTPLSAGSGGAESSSVAPASLPETSRAIPSSIGFAVVRWETRSIL